MGKMSHINSNRMVYNNIASREWALVVLTATMFFASQYVIADDTVIKNGPWIHAEKDSDTIYLLPNTTDFHYTFPLKNIGDQVLIIERTEQSCGGVFEISKNKVAPGEHFELRIRLVDGDMEPEKTNVTIFSNSRRNSALSLTLDVKEPKLVEVKPGDLKLIPKPENNADLFGEFEIWCFGTENAPKIVSVTSIDRNLVIKKMSHETESWGNRTKFSASLLAKKTINLKDSIILIETDCEMVPYVEVQTFGPDFIEK